MMRKVEIRLGKLIRNLTAGRTEWPGAAARPPLTTPASGPSQPLETEVLVTCHPPGLTMGNYYHLGREFNCSRQLKNGRCSQHLFLGMLVFSSAGIGSEAHTQKYYLVGILSVIQASYPQGSRDFLGSVGQGARLYIGRAKREIRPLSLPISLP